MATDVGGLVGSRQRPMDAEAATATAGRHATTKALQRPAAMQQLQPASAPALLADDAGSLAPSPAGPRTPHQQGGSSSSGFMQSDSDRATAGLKAAGSPQRAAQMLEAQQSPTAEKLSRGVLAVGDMLATSVEHTGRALGGALSHYAANLMAATQPLDQPLTVSKSYISRLGMVQMVTQPAAQGAQLAAQWAGELMYYVLQAALLVLRQLQAMKLVPQITALGAATDPTGVPISPVSGGLPLARDELAAFKLVVAALLTAYVQVYDALEDAATQLFRQASAASQRYLSHRHGGEAADVAAAALAILSDLLAVTMAGVRMLSRGLISRGVASSARTYLKARLPDLKLE